MTSTFMLLRRDLIGFALARLGQYYFLGGPIIHLDYSQKCSLLISRNLPISLIVLHIILNEQEQLQKSVFSFFMVIINKLI